MEMDKHFFEQGNNITETCFNIYLSYAYILGRFYKKMRHKNVHLSLTIHELRDTSRPD